MDSQKKILRMGFGVSGGDALEPGRIRHVCVVQNSKLPVFLSEENASAKCYLIW